MIQSKKSVALSITRIQLRQLFKVARHNDTAAAILLLTIWHLLFSRYGKRSRSYIVASAPANGNEFSAENWLIYNLQSFSTETLKEVLAIVQQEINNKLQDSIKISGEENKVSYTSDDLLTWSFSFEGVFPPAAGAPECAVQVAFYRQPDEELLMEIGYDHAVFSETTVHTITSHFLTLIDCIDQAVGISVYDLLKLEGISPENTNDSSIIKIYEIWRQLLHRNVIGAYDDFWMVGGNSLKAQRLIGSLQKAFDMPLTYNDIVEHTTVAGQSELIRNKQQNKRLPVIKQTPSTEVFPLSAMQRSVYSNDVMRKEEAVYNLHVLFDVKGELDTAVMETIVQRMTGQHESLRTVIEVSKDGKVQQRVITDWQTDKLVNVNAAVNRNAALDLANSFIHHPFNLNQGLLFNVYLIRYDSGSSLFLWVIHHLICDGASLEQLVGSFFIQYKREASGKGKGIDNTLFQFRDYIAWEQEITAHEYGRELHKFWQQELSGVEQNPELFFMHPRPSWVPASGKVLPLKISQSKQLALDELKQVTGFNSFVQILTAVAIVLYKYTQHTDWVIGIPVNVRQQAGMENMVGVLINTIPLHIQFAPSTTVHELMQQLKQVLSRCMDHGAYPLEKIIESNAVQTTVNRSPLFDIVINYQYTESDIQKIKVTEGVYAELVWPEQVKVKYDIAFNFFETPGNMHAYVEFSDTLFDEEPINKLVHHFLFILDQLSLTINNPVGELSLLQLNEKERLLEWAGSGNTYGSDQTPAGLFRMQVRQTPDQLAGKAYDGCSITYAELDLLSEKLSNYLLKIFQA